jgi:UbiD family decarboxylase
MPGPSFAVVQGGDPGVSMIGGMAIPAEVDEGSFLGTLYGEPVEVVKCETNDLEVPAGAEVVIEGKIQISRRICLGRRSCQMKPYVA